MKMLTSMILGAAIALALGLSLDAIRNGAAERGMASRADQVDAAMFFRPQLGGMNLDVRMMGHMRADPVRTAERFCRDNGYTGVADIVVRASAATRTIADGAVHTAPGGAQGAFALIRCQSHQPIVVASN